MTPARSRPAAIGHAVHWRARTVGRDLHSRLVGGRTAPRYAERVTIDPAQCGESVRDPRQGPSRAQSGGVLGGDWDVGRAPIRELVKVDACYRHWRDGVPWEETGVYEHMMRVVAERPGTDGCHTIDDVIARYQGLDHVFEQVRSEGRLRSIREVVPGFREEGGVYVHFDRAGRPLFGGGGMHRLAIAGVLGLRSIPAQVGVVHRLAVATWRDSLVAGG